MIQLHSDANFHYEGMRAIGTVPYYGGDIMEIFEIMSRIKAGDFNSWYDEWFAQAQLVLSTVDEDNLKAYSPVTLRNIYLKASHYIFVADFFLHGNKADTRASHAYTLWRQYFDKANALFDIPGIHVTIHADGFNMPAMIFRAAQASAENPRPTVIIGGGFESNMEETFHDFGVAALERGYNVVIYEGPGHRTLIETQKKGFIAEWEQVVTPIVDYISDHKSSDLAFIDTSKLGLVGMSLGGYLAARAAAFEPRLAAVLCIDGVWSMLDTALDMVPQVRPAWEAGDKTEVDRIFNTQPAPETWETGRRWFHDDLLFTFATDSPFEAFQTMAKMTLAGGVAQKIRMPAFVADATADIFFAGQPQRVVQAIGANATLQVFDEQHGAQLHCQSGALVYANQVMWEWFAGVVGH